MRSSQFQDDIINLQANLFTFAMMLTKNRENASDLVQDTTLKALDNEAKFQEGTNLKGWVFTIMRNLFINEYRRSAYAATVIDTTDSLYHLNLYQESGLEAPEGSLTTVEISAEITKLDNDLREPFVMHVKGYKYEEICQQLALPMGTVKNRIFMARKRLQAHFADYR
ncbi:MAG: RNA polymerase sigma factor [Muribaculaceae bacterium]|nr:RNA polymerase sigma factor [Muribaculaceae bacterium]